MRQRLLTFGPLLLLLLGVLAGFGPLPDEAALWAFSAIGVTVGLWMLIRSYGAAPALLFTGIIFSLAFAAEYWIVNVRGLLTHHSWPQIAGVSCVALTQDYFAVAMPIALAFALFPNASAAVRVGAAAWIMFVLDIVGGPYAAAIAYYHYAPPFRAWTVDVGLDQAPPVPWEEPIGMVGMAMVAASAIEVLRRACGWKETAFSLRWSAAVYFGAFILPGWAWAMREGHWLLAIVESILMLTIAVAVALGLRREMDEGESPLEKTNE